MSEDEQRDGAVDRARDPSLLATIPAEIRAQLGDRRATQVGFGAGPGCVAVKLQRLWPPVSIEDALAWLEGYRTTFRRGHVRLEDGARLFFDPTGFRRLAPPGSE